jgi:hypothetical protein
MKDREICLGGAGNFSVYATAAFDNPPVTGPWMSVWMDHRQLPWRTNNVSLAKPLDAILAFFQNFISELAEGERIIVDPADTQFLLRLLREAYGRRAMGTEAANG